ncbi:alanine racemase [Arachnia propionica]|uniref:alanine racemase n=1 Tax=Arachnia propionica TaxID=1750 RepID=UPI003C6FDB21
MTLKLTIDTRAWRDHLTHVHEEFPGLVPVAKGNGYGLGLDVLAREAERLNNDCLAVGTAHEVATVRDAGWSRDVIVLNPWRPFDETATALLDDPRVITVVSRLTDLDELRTTHPGTRVVVELMTSMRRHGITPQEIASVDVGKLGFEGWTMHLPLRGQLSEAKQLASEAVAHQRGAVWVSHLGVNDYRRLRTQLGVQTRMRMGTRLWLGAPQSLRTTATVLDVHRVARGARYGYNQSRAPRDGWLVIVSGGTSHGIALSAPSPARSLRQRGVSLAQGVLDAAGVSRSPFSIAGRKRPFAEPPHMHASMVFVGGASAGVEVGDEIPVTTRQTTTTCDELVWN